MGELSRYFLDLAREARSALESVVHANRLAAFRLHRGHLVALAVFILFQQGYFWTGKSLERKGVLYSFDVLFGLDVPRVVDDMNIRGHNKRSNAHPYFVAVAHPITALFRRGLGVDDYTAAMLVCSSLGGLAVLMMRAYFARRGADPPEAWLFATIFGAGAMPLLSGAVPETAVFAIVTILLFMILAARELAGRPVPELAWLATGVLAYGMTISNAPKAVAARAAGCADRAGGAVRALAMGALTLAIGLALTHAAGSSYRLVNDTWIVTPEERGGSLHGVWGHLARNFLFYDVVAPTPSAQIVSFRERTNFKVVTFNQASYGHAPRALAAVWGAAVAAGVGLALARRRLDDRRMLQTLAICMMADFALHSVYYIPFEGVYLYSAQIVAPLFGLLAPLAREISGWNERRRNAARAALTLFLVALAINNLWVLQETGRFLTTP